MRKLTEPEYPWDLPGTKLSSNQFTVSGTFLSSWEELLDNLSHYRCIMKLGNNQFISCMIEERELFLNINSCGSNLKMLFYGYIMNEKNELVLQVTDALKLPK